MSVLVCNKLLPQHGNEPSVHIKQVTNSFIIAQQLTTNAKQTCPPSKFCSGVPGTQITSHKSQILLLLRNNQPLMQRSMSSQQICSGVPGTHRCSEIGGRPMA